MANDKRLNVKAPTGSTVYAIIKRVSDAYYLNDTDGFFAISPVDPYLSLAEDGTMKGYFSKTENRTTWTDGDYLIAIYQQSGGSPAPVSDTLLSVEQIQIRNDLITTLGVIHDRVFQTLTPILLRLKRNLEDSLSDDSISKELKQIKTKITEITRIQFPVQ